MSLLRANPRLGWLSVRQKFQLNTVTMVHKCRTKQAPPYLCDLFHDRFKVSGRNTRNMSQLNLPKSRLSTGQRSFAFRGAKEYNLLPGNIRSTNDILRFKRKVVHFIIIIIIIITIVFFLSFFSATHVNILLPIVIYYINIFVFRRKSLVYRGAVILCSGV